jgi:hypothetical protein
VNKILIASLLSIVSGAALAGPTCKVPEDRWMKETDFRKLVESQGYEIKVFKVSRGRCYEIYGVDKAGKRVEIYFDPATGRELEKNS